MSTMPWELERFLDEGDDRPGKPETAVQVGERQDKKRLAILQAAILAERERIRRLALAGTEWLEPSDFVPPRASSREGDLWRRAQAVARRELAEELVE